jgi:prevent-host-death family protein
MAARYSIYEAKAKLSEIIRSVKARKRVIITERGVPIAEVVPYRVAASEALSDRVRRLRADGAILPATGTFVPHPVAIVENAVARFLQEDRD